MDYTPQELFAFKRLYEDGQAVICFIPKSGPGLSLDRSIPIDGTDVGLNSLGNIRENYPHSTHGKVQKMEGSHGYYNLSTDKGDCFTPVVNAAGKVCFVHTFGSKTGGANGGVHVSFFV